MWMHSQLLLFLILLQYAKASSMLSVASIRQQFSCPENILMSLYSVQFLKNIHQYLSTENEEVLDVGLDERGYLFLTSEAGETVMRENYALQRYLHYSLSFSVSITFSSSLTNFHYYCLLKGTWMLCGITRSFAAGSKVSMDFY